MLTIKLESEISSFIQENSKRDNYEFLYKTKVSNPPIHIKQWQTNQYSYKVVAFEKEETRHNKLQKLVQLVTKI
ncbi:MAG: hypothetical protein ACKPE1_14795, partial [Dolichospermum sp.]